mgnify:CR=1 FL=1
MKRTFQPSVLKRSRTHGFRARMATKNGRQVLARRRAKGRKSLSAQSQFLVVKLNFSRELRLLTPIQFKNVFEQPFRASTPEITILARKNNLEHPRLGLTVAKKHLKRAHERNRIKRLVRESFRLSQHRLPAYDFVFVAKNGIGKLDNNTFAQILEKLWQRHIRLAQKS